MHVVWLAGLVVWLGAAGWFTVRWLVRRPVREGGRWVVPAGAPRAWAGALITVFGVAMVVWGGARGWLA